MVDSTIGMSMLISITTSMSYAKENGVAPVSLQLMVRCAHKTPSNLFTHLCLALDSLFLNVVSRALLVASTCLLLWENLGVEYKFLILNFEQKFWNAWLSICDPLLVIIAWGIPN